MNKTKKVTITLTQESLDDAKKFSEQIYGRENVSFFIRQLIASYKKTILKKGE